MLKDFLLILSHQNSTHRAQQWSEIQTQTEDNNFIAYYFIGRSELEFPEIDEDNHIIYLPVADNYESLAKKVYAAIEFIHKNYKIAGIFKTDDDIKLDLTLLRQGLNNSQGLYRGQDNEIKAYSSDYHFGKCTDPEINRTPVNVPATHYCSGGGYYLASEVLEKILMSKTIYDHIIYEDVCTGLAMNRYGIYPTKFLVQKNGCVWNQSIAVEQPLYVPPPPPLSQTCRCGQIKDRIRYNFCQKCNKLY